MYTDEDLEVPMCYWYATRIGSVFSKSCGGKTNFCLGCDAIGRRFVYQLLAKLDVDADGPVIDGPVPYLPPGIFGIRQGNGWVVKMADSKNCGYEITSYLEAIKVHSSF